MRQQKGLRDLILAAGVVVMGSLTLHAVSVGVASAQQATSPSYQVNEVFFGTGGELDACSTAYCSKQSAGETAIGTTGSANYQAEAGFNTNREEYIEFVVTNSGTDLGVLSVSTAATATGAFSVKSYLASGYVVQTASDPPKSAGLGGHTFVTSATPGVSVPGTERFGINLVANTSPTTFGSAPVQIPDNTFSFGSVASGYNTTNQYKYVKGDTVAQSVKSSGQTNYTVSYLFNISTSSPAGFYTFNHDLVVTSTF